MRTTQLVDQAFSALKDHLKLNIYWQTEPGSSSLQDGILQLNIERKRIKIYIKIKNDLRNYQLSQLIEFKKKHKTFLVIANYISPNIKEKLRQAHINYLDSAGNAFLHIQNHHIFADGLKGRKNNTEGKSLFTATNLKLIFYFLQKPGLINTTYREIAKTSNVSLDSVSKTISGMKKKGYLIPIDDKRFKLTQKKELFEKWLNGFEVTLKPKIKKGNYRFLDENILNTWEEIKLYHNKALWGAEPAAAKLTDFLFPGNFTIYSSLENQALLKTYKLVPDEFGKVEIIELFFDPEFFECKDTVPPLLVYADLQISGESRNLETAKQIYEKYISHLI